MMAPAPLLRCAWCNDLILADLYPRSYVCLVVDDNPFLIHYDCLNEETKARVDHKRKLDAAPWN